MSRWYRAYEGTVTDAKLGEVALVVGCSRSVAIAAWHCILESAAAVNQGGAFDATPRRVAVILGEQPVLIEQVFAEMANLGMIDAGIVVKWGDRQYQSDKSVARQAAYRERKRSSGDGGDADKETGDGGVTASDRHVTPQDTDTDTDTEAEEQKDAREARVSRGTRLPADFVPLPAIIELGRNRGLTEFEITDQLERFRDWANAATGQVGVKRDWQGTYRNWIKRVADDKLKSQQRRNGGKSSPGEQFRAAFSDLREHLETCDSPGHGDGNRSDEGRDLFRGPGGSRRPGEP